ncbi:MAG TPA: sigma-70 family RNA polymerase sigma factor [Flavitalea sp.]|nr:sigma-70 family RNA polymerase sigma factor [Flavitalea sp.]
MNIFNDSELVRRLQTGDVDAFDSLYHRYQKALFLNILKITRNNEVTSDILQEVFIALWEKKLSLDISHSVAGWLFVVSYNKSIAYLQKELKFSMSGLDANIEKTYVVQEETDLSEIRSKLLHEAIEHLSPQKRKVFELCKIQGKSYEETARELSISKHTVKEYLVISLKYIKDYVKEHPECQSVYLSAAIFAILAGR